MTWLAFALRSPNITALCLMALCFLVAWVARVIGGQR